MVVHSIVCNCKLSMHTCVGFKYDSMRDHSQIMLYNTIIRFYIQLKFEQTKY